MTKAHAVKSCDDFYLTRDLEVFELYRSKTAFVWALELSSYSIKTEALNRFVSGICLTEMLLVKNR